MGNGPFYSRPHKSCCCPEYVCACNCMWKPCRKLVSGKKRRYQSDGYDLDLTYLCPRIIVHGFPAIGLEHIYRNPRYEIRRFLDERHPDQYKMFNFCCEPGRGYEASVYHGRVERYPFKDHNTPPLETIVAFANSAKLFLDADPKNVVSMHCKAGKGRAGLMSCCMLIRQGVVQSATEALDLYDRERVTNRRGLTVVSQRKYVIFFEMLWRQHWGVLGDIGQVPGDPIDAPKWIVPKQPEMRLFGVEVLYCNIVLRNVRIKIYKGTHMAPELKFDTGKGTGNGTTFETDCAIQGNFKVHVEQKAGIFSKTVKVFELWHNTLFMDR